MNYSLNEKESARKSLLPSFPINLASSGLLIVACQRIPIFLSSHWAICVTTSSISRMVSLVELNLIYFYFSLYKIPLPQWITSEIKSFVWGWQRLPGCQRVKRWKSKEGTCDKFGGCAPQAILSLHYLFFQCHWNYAPQKVHLIWSSTFSVNAMSVFSPSVQLCNSILESLYLSYEGVICHCCNNFRGSLPSSPKQNSNLIQRSL